MALGSTKPASLEQRIDETEQEIWQQEATISCLSGRSHEVADASQHLKDICITPACLRASKIGCRFKDRLPLR